MTTRQQPCCWQPPTLTPIYRELVEGCTCICQKRCRGDLCCCHGNQTNVTSNLPEESTLSTLEEFDSIKDILAVSHVSEKPTPKNKPPFMRAKTLPAMVTPSLSIIQVQPEVNNTFQTTGISFSSISLRKNQGKPSLQKISEDGYTWSMMTTEEEVNTISKSPSVSPVSSRPPMSPTSSLTSQPSGSKQGGEQSRTGLAKLARFLSPRERLSASKTSQFFNELSPSEVSDTAATRKSSSIDSLLEASIKDTVNIRDDSLTLSTISTSAPLSANIISGALYVSKNKAIPPSPSVPSKLEVHRKGNIPCSPSVPSRLPKGITGLRQGSVEEFLENLTLARGERKRVQEVNKFSIDLQALFVAVVHGHVERTRSILETTDVDVNSTNGDGFNPLDIAIMSHCVPMIKLLQFHGGKESRRFSSKESRTSRLVSLVNEAERCREDLTTCILNTATSGTLSTALLKKKERQLTLWQRRLRFLKRMRDGFEQIRPPDPPKHVQLEVIGTRALQIKISESDTSNDTHCVVTKYKVDWSRHEDFSLLAGSQDITDLQRLEVTIPDLTQRRHYYVRVAAGNTKGFSIFQTTSPPFGVPSSWKDVEKKSTRGIGKLKELENIFHQVINSRPAHAAELKGVLDQPLDTPYQQRRQVKRNIKHLFTSAPRFQKTLKRGVHLACLFYNEGKVLVTTEEVLPVVEIDESYPSSLQTDFYWLMKVACTWEDIKTLRQDMEKSQSSSVLHFRSKLLQAVEQMQMALGVQDIGQLYYKPIKDSKTIVVLSTIKYISDPKKITILSVRWLPLAKILRKHPTLNLSDAEETPHVSELLLSSIQHMINYNQESTASLSRGLYLGYIKLKSSVDVIRVLAPRRAPNVLPFSRIRENPHVSREEWDWIKALNSQRNYAPSTVQLKFQKAISSAVRILFSSYDIPFEEIGLHRLYDIDVIELSTNVSFILVLPPVDNICSVPGQNDELTSRMDCIPLPIQVFEILNMTTYQSNFIAHYSRLSSILEMDTLMAQHAHREAFFTSEVVSARERLCQLQTFQTQVDNIWKDVRWIMDILTFARDKQINGGLPLSHIYLHRRGSPSPKVSPQQSPVKEHPTSSLRMTSSTSESKNSDTKGIRRTYSTSKLGSDSVGPEVKLSQSTTFGPKACSTERVGVSFSIGHKDDTMSLASHKSN
ncbi:ankyrin repeat and fibronectin type-III domain-containing protein 1-like isoform X5 [Tachypleus tridentatus]|uniref:ankyrin repeat and fibronectin type-III domain-containing protein 1-like isoform X5 n=1 Tax=Tachypleus tridentatus TaxID=6853 RepID=UPI003FCF3DC5